MNRYFTILLMLLTCALTATTQPNYSFSSSSTTMTPIGTPSNFGWNTTTANDEEYSTATNIGFNFTYDGTVFTQFQVSTNGFLVFGNGLAAATATDALNGTLRNVIAPLWDDLAVGTTNDDIIYELNTSGGSGDYILTVEWKNVKWNKTAGAANASFQIKLYESDGKIEIIYGTMSAPTAGSASIGLNDGTASGTWGTFQSINVGGSGTAFHVSMVYPFNAIANAPATGTMFTFTQQTVTPMSGTYTVGDAPSDFATPSIAAQALNLNGINGSVTMNVKSGTYDDIFHLINVAGTESGKTITIQNSGGAVTLSPRNGSRSGSGSTSADMVVVMLGTDYTTFDGIGLLHNASNSTGTLQFEFGYFMANFNGTDGAQYNTIKNANIVGSNTASLPANFRGIRTSGGGFTSVTAPSGAISYNTFKNLTIQQCGISVYISGMNGTYPDVGNIVTADGGYAGNTTGYNDIGSASFANTTAGMRGFFFDAQDSLTVEKTEVRNITNTSPSATTQDVTGIGTFTSNTSKVITIQNNIVHGLTGTGTTTQVVYGIWLVSGTHITVKNNVVYDLQGGINTTSGTVRGILHNVASTTANKVYLVNNMVYDLRNTQSQASNYAVRCVELNSADSVFMYHNTLYLDATTSLTTQFFATACLYVASSTNMELDLRNNILVNKSQVSSNASSRAIGFAKSTATIGTQISTTTNNNLLYAGTPGASRVLAYDATTAYQTLSTYQAWLGGGREANALSADPVFVDDASPGYDLRINTTSWVVNGQGVPVNTVTISSDYEGNARSTSLVNGPVDIGADEYTPTGSASASESGTLADGQTTTYTGVDGKTIAQITWSVGSGTLPTSVAVTYTPGAQASNTVNPSIYRAFTITPTGGAAGWSADVKLYYNASSELKGYTETSMRVNSYSGSGTDWSVLPTTIVDGSDYGQFTTGSFSTYSFDDGTNALPVELTSFTAVMKSGRVELQWSTASETNNKGFEVQRSVAGEWSALGFVSGAGTSNAPKQYSYVDANAKGTVQYRLKQVDNDGSITYSSVVEIAVAAVAERYELAQNYPNPFNPTTTIRFAVKNTEQTRVTVYDIAGREVAVLFNDVAQAGQQYSVPFNGTGLSSGIYFYVLQTPGAREVRKMQLLK